MIPTKYSCYFSLIGLLCISTTQIAAQTITPVNLQTGITLILPSGGIANDVAVINADGDARPDLLVPMQGLNRLKIYIQPTLHNYGQDLSIYTSQQPLSVLAMNFTTGSTVSPPNEFVVLTANGNVTSWRPGSGGVYQAGTAVPLRGGLACAATDRLVSGNYEVGNGPDLAGLSNGPQPSIARLANRGNGVFQPMFPLPRRMADSALVLTTIDLDDDFDLLEEALVPRLNDPTGSFAIYTHIGGVSQGTNWWSYNQVPVIPIGGRGPAVSLATADINGDDFADVVVAAADGPASGRVYVRRFLDNTPPLTFQAPIQSVVVGDVPREVRLADLNGDRRPELLVLGAGGTLQVFTNISRTGTIVFDPTPLTLSTGPDPALIRIADADGDGDLDVIVPCRGNGTVRVFWNMPQGLATTPQADALACTVYPNPAQNELHIAWKGMGPQPAALLLDLAGRCVRRWEPGTFTTDLAVGDLARGLYILRLAGREGAQVNRRVELR